MLDNSPYWTEQRRQIVTWLNDHAPSFTDGYVAAVQMLHTSGFPARVQLVSHIVRDIYRLLPPILGQKALPRPAEVFPGLVKELATQWGTFPPSIDANAEYENDLRTIRMHPRVYDKIVQIVNKSQEMANRQSTIGGVFASALSHLCHRSANEFIAPWVIKSFDAEYDFFVGQAHLNRVPIAEGLIDHFEAFERAFHSLVGSYFLGKDELDSILQDANQDTTVTPNVQQVQTALQRIRTAEFAVYFFSRLQNPQWMHPLGEHGLFKDPPPGIRVDGGVRHPYWPASQYLARMADVAPGAVADILVSIETDNPSVLRDIVDAANKMPAEIAVALVPTVCRAIEADVFGVIFPKATDLCVRLANNGQEDAAMTLADALFGSAHQPGQGTRGDRDHHLYKKGLEKVVPVLVERRPKQFIGSLCKWLGAAIKQEKRYGDPEIGEDRSWYWRPAIEEHEQNRDYDFPCEMVGFVRQAFEQAISDGRLTLENGLAIAEEQPSSVFRRLRIHLVSHFADQTPKLARSIMMNRSMLEDAECKHEYAMLVGHRFLMLSQEDRDTWLGWITAGPDMKWYDEYHKKGSNSPESLAADRQNYVCGWQLDRLHWIREHLDGRWRDVYQELLDTFDEPLYADLNSYHGPVRFGFDSPFTIEELNVLSFAESLEKVDVWQPGRTRSFPNDPQKEGLAGTFGQYVTSKAEEVSAQAELLKGKQPIYVRTFIDKMTDAVAAGKIDIGAILRLCVWVVEQPAVQDTTAATAPWDRVDRDWQYTRDSICRFVRTICNLDSENHPRYSLSEFRKAIGVLLTHLTRDPAKSDIADEKERNSPDVHDFVDSAINSHRGKVVDALVAYARWIAMHVQRKEAGRMVVPNGLNDMPEVREMLERQISEDNASFYSFAIIGSYIGLFQWIDQSWVEDNAPKIFDLAKIEHDPTRAPGWAAWNAFLVWGQPNLPSYRMLRTQYAYAVGRLPCAVLPENAGRTPLHHLGEQLILLYGRGSLAECNDEKLLYQFLEVAPGDVRSQTVAFVGHSLSHSEKLPEAILARFQTLWDWYWPKFGALDAKARPQGGLFGQWFTSKKFPDEWSLERLERFLQVVPIPDFAERIAERLTELADVHLETVTRILDRMIRADEEGWRAYAWREPAEKILKSALQGNDNVRGMAVRLIDDLGRRGYVEFGKLLSPSTQMQGNERGST